MKMYEQELFDKTSKPVHNFIIYQSLLVNVNSKYFLDLIIFLNIKSLVFLLDLAFINKYSANLSAILIKLLEFILTHVRFMASNFSWKIRKIIFYIQRSLSTPFFLWHARQFLLIGIIH